MSTTVTDDMTAEYRKQLADELAAAGLLNDPAWRRAWETVPRHLFVPRFAISAPGQPGPAAVSWYDGSDPAERPRWLAAVYRNEALITRYADNGVAIVFGQFSGQAGFMALRAEDELPTPTSGRVFEVTGGVAERQQDADVPASLDFTVASFLASLIAEGSQLMFVHSQDGTVVDYRWWHPASDSWGRVEPRGGGPARVHETGTRQLWDEIASILADWDNAGRPGIDQFGLTITPQRHTLWIGSPSSPQQWKLQ